MHLVGFIIRLYHDARIPERQSGVISPRNLDLGTRRR